MSSGIESNLQEDIPVLRHLYIGRLVLEAAAILLLYKLRDQPIDSVGLNYSRPTTAAPAFLLSSAPFLLNGLDAVI